MVDWLVGWFLLFSYMRTLGTHYCYLETGGQATYMKTHTDYLPGPNLCVTSHVRTCAWTNAKATLRILEGHQNMVDWLVGWFLLFSYTKTHRTHYYYLETGGRAAYMGTNTDYLPGPNLCVTPHVRTCAWTKAKATLRILEGHHNMVDWLVGWFLLFSYMRTPRTH